MISCWSVKGGSGTSVVSALLAIAAAGVDSTVLVDLDGDQPAIFGLPTPTTGFHDWWESELGADALQRLAVDISPTLRFVGAGRSEETVSQRDFETIPGTTVIVDAGTIRGETTAARVVEVSDTSLLVLRPCYLAARRAAASALRIDGLVVVEEHGRALSAQDLAEVVGAPVVATVPWELSIARAIDAGRLGNRVPRSAKSIEQLATTLMSKANHGG